MGDSSADTARVGASTDPTTERALYEVEWDGKDDYLPDSALDRIKEVVLDRLPVAGFDMPSCNATQRTVTATLAFDLIRDPESQIKALEAVLQAATVVRTLHANLVAARAMFGACSDSGVEVRCPACDGCGGFLVDSMTLYGVHGGFDWGDRCERCEGSGVLFALPPLTTTERDSAALRDRAMRLNPSPIDGKNDA